MIKVSVDEAYAYDMLSILMVKSEVRKDKASYDLYHKLEIEIANQTYNHAGVMASQEFLRLVNTNAMLFKKIDDIKVNGEKIGDAKEIDTLNYERFLAKKNLQSKFFPNIPITEQKIGYK